MNAAMPPAFCAFATACSASDVFPLLSGPYISTMRPRGRPPRPSATSSAIDPVGITSIGSRVSSPRRMTEPLPNCRSIWSRADSRALSLSPARSRVDLVFPAIGGLPAGIGGLRASSASPGVVLRYGPAGLPADRWTRYAPPLTFPYALVRGISRTMVASAGDLNHFRWVNYRANVYSIYATRRRRPEILENRAGAGLADGCLRGLAAGVGAAA